jgi:ABC-type multidrug transport system fused ATPase/permease subunit
MQVAFEEVRTQIANMNTFVQERVTGMKIVQLFNREDIEFDKFKNINDKHVQHGDYVGRIHKYTKAQVINKYGHKLTEKEQKKLLKTEFDTYSTGYEDNFFGQEANVSYKKMFESHFHNIQTVAFEDEPEYYEDDEKK